MISSGNVRNMNVDYKNFFNITNCMRCGCDILNNGRIMSWFNTDVICMDCKRHEDKIKNKLPNSGIEYEGCGYIPNIEESK